MLWFDKKSISNLDRHQLTKPSKKVYKMSWLNTLYNLILAKIVNCLEKKVLSFLKTYRSPNQIGWGAFGQGGFWTEGFLERRLLLLMLLLLLTFGTGGYFGWGASYFGSFWLGDFWYGDFWNGTYVHLSPNHEHEATQNQANL